MKFLKLFFLVLFFPLISAEECGIMNLASCIPQKIYDFFIGILNAPIIPLLDLIKSLLTEPVNLSLFSSLWAIMIYVISIFYAILMLYSGFNFIISGHDAVKRAKAKQWFFNIFLMIVLVQASYFLYSLVLDISSLLTAGIINMVDDSFFLITADNLTNIGLEFFFSFNYVGALFITTVFLTLRYIIVAVGIVFVPIGIFCYLIPPLNGYGRLIINFLGICIFVTFFDALIFLICSQLVQVYFFASFKILVMISALLMADFIMFYFMFFSALKSAFKTTEKVAGTALAVAKYFA